MPEAAPRARLRLRHLLVLLSFLGVVLVPALATAWYLYVRAEDQYASTTAFTVQAADAGSSLDVMGEVGSLFGGNVSKDAEILYQFIQSEEMVARIDARLNLRALYGRHYDRDPLFGLAPGATIEDLVEHWGRMVRIAFDSATGLTEIRALAFDPAEAREIARAIIAESTERINALSQQARSDATRYAREELDASLERLARAREALTAFRVRTQIVDPSADLQGQMGLLSTLQAQMAETLIELDLLRETAREGDPRLVQLERRIEVIQARIDEERARIGGGAGPAGQNYATVVAEFERLNLEREFAEQAYRSALSARDAAVAEAQRQNRYLATYVAPTLAESSRYPEREMILGIVALFLVLGWGVMVLVAYSIRDSR
ncbi:MAG: sugar transporter [Rhodobacteraceae bacterium]|nr:sugar transporter [Paracoccaceae bacterium]